MFEGPVCEPQVQDEDRLEAGQYWWQWLDLGRTPTLRPIGQALEIIDRLVVALFDLSIPEPRLYADRLFSCARALRPPIAVASLHRVVGRLTGAYVPARCSMRMCLLRGDSSRTAPRWISTGCRRGRGAEGVRS
jgi:hypothetical protein